MNELNKIQMGNTEEDELEAELLEKLCMIYIYLTYIRNHFLRARWLSILKL